MKKTCLLAAVAGLACTSVAPAKPPMEQARPGVEIQPISIARVVKADGKIVLAGEWLPYTGGIGTRSAQINAVAFDGYGREPGTAPTSSGVGMNCPMSCVGPGGVTVDTGARWYFGSGYHNPNTIEDMQDSACPPDSVISEIDAGWFWGVPAPEPCYLVYFPFEEVLEFDGAGCTDPASFTPTAGGAGIALYMDRIPPATTYYYTRPSGLEILGATLPGTDDNGDANGHPDGSYQLIIASSVTSTGITQSNGPTQPMLWGTAQHTGDPRPGLNNGDSYDDDFPTDGDHDQAECYDYTYGLCPDPIGKMNAFCYRRCAADFNNDGFVDGIDADQFNNTFEGFGPLPAIWADLNGDCFVDGLDADYFNDEFESACP